VHRIFHDVAVVCGLTNPGGSWYLFWSGIGSDASKLAIVAGIIQHTRHRRVHDQSVHEKLDRLAGDRTSRPRRGP